MRVIDCRNRKARGTGNNLETENEIKQFVGTVSAVPLFYFCTPFVDNTAV